MMKRQQAIKLTTALALMAAFAFSATHPAFAVQTFSVVTCNLVAPTPCVGGTNTNTGPGIQGISSLGFGNVGQNLTSTQRVVIANIGELACTFTSATIRQPPGDFSLANDTSVTGVSMKKITATYAFSIVIPLLPTQSVSFSTSVNVPMKVI